MRYLLVNLPPSPFLWRRNSGHQESGHAHVDGSVLAGHYVDVIGALAHLLPLSAEQQIPPRSLRSLVGMTKGNPATNFWM